MEEARKRPLFVPFSEQIRNAAFARGLAVHNGATANTLLPVAEKRRWTLKSCDSAQKRVHTDSLGDMVVVYAAPTIQQQKKVPCDGGSEPKHSKSLSIMPQVQPPAVEVGVQNVKLKRICGG